MTLDDVLVLLVRAVPGFVAALLFALLALSACSATTYTVMHCPAPLTTQECAARSAR